MSHFYCLKHTDGQCCDCIPREDCKWEMKPSDLFEGENSSLRKTFDNAVMNKDNIVCPRDWEIEFDDLYWKKLEFCYCCDGTDCGCYGESTSENVKNFIRFIVNEALEQGRKEVAEKALDNATEEGMIWYLQGIRDYFKDEEDKLLAR